MYSEKDRNIFFLICYAVCALMIVGEYLARGYFSFGIPALMMILSATDDFLEWRREKKDRKLLFGMLKALMAVLCLIFYVSGLLQQG